MMMTDYIRAVKMRLLTTFPETCTLLEQQGEEVIISLPDGVYPIEIEGKIDYVAIERDRIFCCNRSEADALAKKISLK